ATLPSGLSTLLASALSTSVSSDSTGSGSGSIAFTFSATDQIFDFLAANQTLTVIYKVTVTDSTGTSSTQPVTITITGTNDAPVLAADASGPHAITELAGKTGDTVDHDTTAGTLSFTDVDLSDTHTVGNSLVSATWSGGATLPSGLSAVLSSALSTSVSSDSTGSGSGSVAFTLSATDRTFDFLAANQTLTVTYDVTVTDNSGLSSTKPVTITITGTNDTPMLAADTAGPHAITELAGKTGDTADHDTTSGTLTFTDVDLSNTHTVGNSLVSATWSGGATLPSGLNAVLASSLSTSVSSDSTGSGSGTVAFTFSATDNTFDFLAANQTLTITYNVPVTDNTGALPTQPVTITITGTDDAPVLSVAATASPYTQNGPPVTLLSAATVSDVDNQTMQSAIVSISSGFLTGDVLAFTNTSSTTYGNITASYDATQGVLTLTSAGATATLAQWQAALDAVQYSSTSSNPTNFGNDPSRT